MKNNIKKLLLAGLFAIICSAGAAFANGLDNRDAVGVYVLGAEKPVGGIQYEHRYTDFISNKFGAFVFYDNDSYTDPLDMNFTVETDFTLYASEWKEKIASRLFAYALVGYTACITKSYDYNSSTPSLKTETFVSNAVASLGFGFDFTFFGHLSIPVQFGFMGTFPQDTQIGFCGGIGLRYAW